MHCLPYICSEGPELQPWSSFEKRLLWVRPAVGADCSRTRTLVRSSFAHITHAAGVPLFCHPRSSGTFTIH